MYKIIIQEPDMVVHKDTYKIRRVEHRVGPGPRRAGKREHMQCLVQEREQAVERGYVRATGLSQPPSNTSASLHPVVYFLMRFV